MKKNVILIMQDHQLFYKHDQIKRPNYEKFIETAVNYRNAVSVTPLCAPTRRSMLNGIYAHKHGLYNNGAKSKFVEQTYFDVLRENGYVNYYFGKWHAGDYDSSYFGCKGFTPSGYSCPYKYSIYDEYLKRYNLTDNPKVYIEHTFSEKERYIEKSEMEIKKIENLYSLSFGELLDDENTHECFFLANLAIEQLEKLKDSEKPFTMRIDFWGPHQPYFPTKKFLDMYDENNLEIYPSFYDNLENKPDCYLSENGIGISKDGSLIQPNPLDEKMWKKLLKYAYAQNTLADYAVGKILDKVNDLGLDENTLIIWSADHGDALCSHGGHIDKDAYLSNEVLSIPLAVKYPNCKEGITSDDYVSNIDIPVTILDYLGLKLNHDTDGISLLNETKKRDYFVSTTHGHFRKHVALSLKIGNYKFIENYGDINELYDLENDPYELNNLISDSKYETKIKMFKQKLEEWKVDKGFIPYK